MSRVVVLAGGTGGAKLAAGMQELAGADLAVIANTADDIEIHGVHVSPDPDLITYWLSGEIDEERGWGIAGDTFAAFERLVTLGSEEWFGLGDRDLAACLHRTRRLREGRRLTEAQAEIAAAAGVAARVLPMSDDPVRAEVVTPGGRRGFQEYMIIDRCEPEVLSFELRGAETARPSSEALEAIHGAEAIVIGPSNPICSIGPILALEGLRDALATASAPVVAVSPFVAGRAIKGPTEIFMRTAGRDASAAGVADQYGDLLDGLVVDADDPDPPPATPRTLSCPTLMADLASRVSLARRVLEFCDQLRTAD